MPVLHARLRRYVCMSSRKDRATSGAGNNGKWQKLRVDLDWNRTPHAVAFDPRNPSRIFAISDGGGLSRSLDGGKTWTMFGPEMAFANTLGWLPQKTGWRSNAGVTIDRDGVCWIAQGNEGMLRCNMHR